MNDTRSEGKSDLPVRGSRDKLERDRRTGVSDSNEAWDDMRIAILGAGGVGGYYGGVLARAGYDVVMLARGPHLDALRSAASRSGPRKGVLPPPSKPPTTRFPWDKPSTHSSPSRTTHCP